MGVQADSWIKRRLISVDEYHRMGELGLIGPQERVELIEGEVIAMAPIGPDHIDLVNLLTKLLVQAAGERAIVSVQNPVRLDKRNEPEPDFALLKPRQDYRRKPPQATDVLLIIEVSNTSERYDREIKLPLYAASGIPEVWQIDIAQRALSIYREPQGERYAHEQRVRQLGVISLAALPGVSVDLATLFPAG